MLPWDIFISHASEDKESFVDPLAQTLKKLAVRVWYDKFELTPGDRLSEKIAEGLANSRCGVLVLSPSFINKPWPKYELSGLVNRFVEENTRLIPIWYGVTRQDIAKLNPALADLIAIIANENDINSCALEILKSVRPQLYNNLSLLASVDNIDPEIKMYKRSDLKDGPIRHHDLPDSLLVRIQNIWYATNDIVSMTLEKTIENFQRDLRPENEVEVWEVIISGLYITMNLLETDSLEVKKEAFIILFSFAEGNYEYVFSETKKGNFHPAITEASAKAWLKVIPKTTIDDVEQS